MFHKLCKLQLWIGAAFGAIGRFCFVFAHECNLNGSFGSFMTIVWALGL